MRVVLPILCLALSWSARGRSVRACCQACLLLLALSTVDACAAVIPAASPALTDVRAAVALASTGDTVTVTSTVPTTVTWTGNLQLNKSIQLIGPGRDLLTIVSGVSTQAWYSNGKHGGLIESTVTGSQSPFSSTHPFLRVSGFTFDGAAQSGCGLLFQNNAAANRVDNCRFVRCSAYAIFWYGPAKGLVDSCEFLDNQVCISVNGNNQGEWLTPVTLSSTNNVGIESSFFKMTGAYYAPIAIDCSYAGSYLLRSCVCSNYSANNGIQAMDGFAENHGNQGPPDFNTPLTSPAVIRGPKSIEEYSNVFSTVTANYAFAHRGQTLIAFDNQIFCTDHACNLLNGTVASIHGLNEEDGWRNGNPAFLSWPAYDMTTNSFIWNEQINGGFPSNPGGVTIYLGGNTPCPYVDGCNFRCATNCSTGLPLPASGNIFIQQNRDWFLLDPRTHTMPSTGAPYVPLQFPHPLVTYYATNGSGGNPTFPGSFSLASSSYTVVEGNTVVATVNRSNGSDGVVSVNWATAPGTAVAGVNYVSSSGTLNWPAGDSAPRSFTVPTINAGLPQGTTKTFSVTLSGPTGGATIGSPASAVVNVQGSVPAGPPTLPAPPWTASQAFLSSPTGLATNAGTLAFTSGTDQTASTNGGTASFQFVVASNATYRAWVQVSGTGIDDQNPPGAKYGAYYVSFNGVGIVDPTNVFDAVATSPGVFTKQYINARGTGSQSKPQFPLRTWLLNAGTNTLTFATRLAGAYVSQVSVEPNAPVVSVAGLSSRNGYFTTNAVVPVTVAFTDIVFTNGSATSLTLNSGGVAPYASGSGTTNLVFTYTVGPGDTAKPLDVLSTNSLSGAIFDSFANPVSTTLPAPGSAGSLTPYNVIIDTVGPNPAFLGWAAGVVTPGTVLSNVVSYTDANPGTNFLQTSRAVLNTTGFASGTVSAFPTGATGGYAVVTVSTNSGPGTLSVTLLPSATDAAGNQDPGVTSSVFTVAPQVTGARVGSARIGNAIVR